MNILFISPHLYPCHIGGVEVFNHHLIRALARHHRVWVLSSCGTDFGDQNIRLIKTNPTRLGFKKPSLLFEHSLFILKNKNSIDLIHVPYTSRSWIYGCYLPLFRKWLGLPYVLVLHGGAMLPWKPRLPHRLLFRKAAAIVAVSERIREEYTKRSGREIQVIPPLIPFQPSSRPKSSLKEAYGYREDEQVILSLGSIKKIKGSDLLLEAFFLLGEEEVERQGARLLLVGDGPMRGALEEEVRKRRFDRWVRFLGLLPHDKVPDAFGLADIYVIPSLAEGAPLSLMEAMFNGLPVIGSDIESIRLFIRDGENGLLFGAGDSLALREKLAVLLADQGLRERLSRAARKTAEAAFRFEDVVKRHLVLYEEIAGAV